MAQKNPTPDALATRLFAITMLGVVVYISAIVLFLTNTEGASYTEHSKPTKAEIQIAASL